MPSTRNKKIRERLKDNIYINSLSQSSKFPTEEQLDKDASSVASKDPLVNKLTQLRSNILAHKNKGQILSTRASITSITWDEVDELVIRGISCFLSVIGAIAEMKGIAPILLPC